MSALNVFRDLLGPRYDDLPGAVQRFHEPAHDHYRGTAFSGGSDHALARLIRRVFGFPETGAELDVEIWLSQENGRDRWCRRFAARRFSSSFSAAPDGVLDERFPPFRFGFHLQAEGGRMHWVFRRWSLGPVPLPRFLGPRIETWETEAVDGGFEFYSHADFPLIGRLIHYHGVVHPVPPAEVRN
ncbi:DUF4166 domain-containing protein [Marimonas arenosa]|uniref:DUF4166 domain-containing protein n=1 Tax=Marimonas arenosa TaxID=1795305 RepID=A0AAE3WF83_9RHOB|nr:DUF4166 domain-containing protein [Marimonas arenosa]MDQ2091433.1 DUF4166 domain-containing protein [Marimonas arenosa]